MANFTLLPQNDFDANITVRFCLFMLESGCKEDKLEIKTLAKGTAEYIVLIIICHICAFAASLDSYPMYFAAVLIFSLPIAMYGCAQTTIRKEAALKHLSPNTIIYKITSKRTLSFAVQIISAIVISFVIPVFTAIFSAAEYFSYMITLPLVLAARFFILKAADKIYKKRYVEFKAQLIINSAVVFIGIIVSSLLIWLFSDFSNPVLCDYKNFQNNRTAFAIGSVINNFNTVINAFLNNDLSQQMTIPLHLVLVIFFLQGGVLFFSLTRFVLFFFLSHERKKSIFSPVSESAAKQINVQITVSFFIFFVLAFSAVSALFYIVCSNEEKVKYADDKTVFIAEKISDKIYRIGTLNKLEKLEQNFCAETKEELAHLVNQYFDETIAKTDNYLDWYYSLSHEYSQLLAFIAGIAANKLEEKMQEFIGKHLEEKLSLNYDLNDKLESVYGSLYEKFDNAKKIILSDNCVVHANSLYHIAIQTEPEKIYKIKEPAAAVSANIKAGISISAGLGSGIAAKVITQNLLKKLSAKIAAKTVNAAVSKKTLTAAASAVGSAAGPIGTAVGAGVGLGVGILTDRIIIAINETISREKYKQDIISCIEEERLFYLQQIEQSM